MVAVKYRQSLNREFFLIQYLHCNAFISLSLPMRCDRLCFDGCNSLQATTVCWSTAQGVTRVPQYSVWLRTGRPGFDPRQRQRIFPLTCASRPALGPTQPPVQWVPGGSFPGGKGRPGRDADHSPPSSAEVKKEQELYLQSPRCASMERNGTALPFFYLYLTYLLRVTTALTGASRR
jgi:hypothetical protein